jgi:hypothetical protein
MENFSAIIRRTSDLPVLTSWLGATMPINGAAEEKAQSIQTVISDRDFSSIPNGFYTVDGQMVETPLVGGIYVHVLDGIAYKVVYKK